MTKTQLAQIDEALVALDNIEQTENPLYWLGICRGLLQELRSAQ